MKNDVVRTLVALNRSIKKRDATGVSGFSRSVCLVCHEAALQQNGQWNAKSARWAKSIFEGALDVLSEMERELSAARAKVLDRYYRLLPYIEDAIEGTRV